jgi:hypothetical protein
MVQTHYYIQLLGVTQSQSPIRSVVGLRRNLIVRILFCPDQPYIQTIDAATTLAPFYLERHHVPMRDPREELHRPNSRARSLEVTLEFCRSLIQAHELTGAGGA